MSDLIQYIVVHRNNRWEISLQGEHYGPYVNQNTATEAAVTAAKETHRRGIKAQVLIQRADNSFRTEWTYGNDPYPPKG